MIEVLITLAVASEVLCCLGLVVMRDVYDRLHYAMASSTVPPFLLAAAVLVDEGWTQPGINALTVAVVLFFASPVVAHATARAGRSRRG